MIQFTDLIQIIGDSFFSGSMYVAGVIVLITILAVIMAFSKKLTTTMVLGIPIIMIFSYLRILPDEITLVMLIVIVLGLGYSARGVFR